MQLILYSKPDCPLCEELKADLEQMEAEFGFVLTERNIADDPADFARFQYLIPVLDTGERLLFPPHTYHSLRSALATAQRKTT